MSIYPAGIVEFRDKVNLPGIEFKPDDKRTLFVEDIKKIENEVIAIEEVLGEEVQGAFATVADRLDDMEAATAAIMSLVYPVGSIYINATNTSNPNILLGFGTWVAWGVGRAIVGIDIGQTEFNTAEKTGGTKTETLSDKQMPAHTHGPGSNARFINYDNTVSSETVGEISGSGWKIAQTTGSAGSSTATASTGGGEAHNNLMPYQVGYVWKRTA